MVQEMQCPFMRYTLVQSLSKNSKFLKKGMKPSHKSFPKAGSFKKGRLAEREERLFRQGNENKNMVAGTDAMNPRFFITWFHPVTDLSPLLH